MPSRPSRDYPAVRRAEVLPAFDQAFRETDSILLTTAGAVAVVFVNDETQTPVVVNLAAGVFHQLHATQIAAAGTTVLVGEIVLGWST